MSQDNNAPAIQAAQKCPWCGHYITCYDEIGVYNGAELRFRGWMCHEECNIYYSPLSTFIENLDTHLEATLDANVTEHLDEAKTRDFYDDFMASLDAHPEDLSTENLPTETNMEAAGATALKIEDAESKKETPKYGSLFLEEYEGEILKALQSIRS